MALGACGKSGGKAGWIKEADEPKIYSPGQSPVGTEAAVYQSKIAALVSDFVPSFDASGELTKIKGYDTPLAARTAMFYSSNFQ